MDRVAVVPGPVAAKCRDLEPEEAFTNELIDYWDAVFTGKEADPGCLSPRMVTLVNELHAYQQDREQEAMVGRVKTIQRRAKESAKKHSHTIRKLTLIPVALAIVVIATTILTSDRSILSGNADPNWIPGLSDDWLKGVIGNVPGI